MTPIAVGQRLVVTGGRDYNDRAFVWAVLDELKPTKIATGCCPTGADKHARDWAIERDVPYEDYPAKWIRFGRFFRGAGPERNRFMLDDFKPDAVLAFPGGSGTADCCKAAEERRVFVGRAARSMAGAGL